MVVHEFIQSSINTFKAAVVVHAHTCVSVCARLFTEPTPTLVGGLRAMKY